MLMGHAFGHDPAPQRRCAVVPYLVPRAQVFPCRQADDDSCVADREVQRETICGIEFD